MKNVRHRTSGLHKKCAMHLAFLGAWGFIAVWVNPRLFLLFSEANTTFTKICLIPFILCLNIFWFFGSYYIMLFVFTLLPKKGSSLRPLKPSEQPKVAILYMTMNDFQYRAAHSCVNQDYSNYHVFILDDSTEQHTMNEINTFKKKFEEKVTVIRRKERKGFKAGSINNALRNHVHDFPYFAVIDSDGIIPVDFLNRLLPCFGIDESIGFVQGSHRPNPSQKSKFASELASGIIAIWGVYFSSRNDYGFVSFQGHGGILRRDLWETVGGIPELVSEDLAFATKIAGLGYRGYYVDDVISYEDFPETYPQLRKQQEKYIKGSCEYFATCFWSFFKSRKIKWFEKLDVFLSCTTLFLPITYIFFLLVFCLLLYSGFAEVKPFTISLYSYEIEIGNIYLPTENFMSIWRWDFYLIFVFMTIAPAAGCFHVELLKRPIKLFRLLFLSMVPYLSLMVVYFFGILTYIVTRKEAFLVTADKKETTLYSYPGSSEKISWFENLNSSHKFVRIIELILGLCFIYLSLRILNLSLLAFAISSALGYFIYDHGWDNKVLRPFLYLPFLSVVAGIGLISCNLIGAQGIFSFLFAFHF